MSSRFDDPLYAIMIVALGVNILIGCLTTGFVVHVLVKIEEGESGSKTGDYSKDGVRRDFKIKKFDKWKR